MRPEVQSLSWWVRRAPDCDPGGFFFRDGLQLPMYGQKGNNWDATGSMFIFSMGGFFEFELMHGAGPRPRFERPEQQDEVPVLRTFDLDAAVDAVAAGNGEVIRTDEDDPSGRTVYFLDPSGAVNGLREASTTSTDPCDVVARERHEAGEPALPGLKPMPPWVFDIGWVQLHVADVPASVAFYRDVLGLDLLEDRGADGALLWLGDVARLEIKPGGERQPRATDRAEVPEMFMLRVRDMDAIVAHLKDSGVHFVNDPWWFTGGHLAYFVDPENHLVGIQDHPEDGRPQEQLALRRWEAGPIR